MGWGLACMRAQPVTHMPTLEPTKMLPWTCKCGASNPETSERCMTCNADIWDTVTASQTRTPAVYSSSDYGGERSTVMRHRRKAWRPEPPTEAGWWWYRSAQEGPVVRHVHPGHGALHGKMVTDDGRTTHTRRTQVVDVAWLPGEWWGPLEAPNDGDDWRADHHEDCALLIPFQVGHPAVRCTCPMPGARS